MTGRLAGKRCIVTGAAGGLGAATVRRFLAEGAEVIAVDITEPADPASSGPLVTVRCDVADESAAIEALRRHGPADVVATFAGLSVGGRLHETTRTTWQRVLDVNVLGTVAWIAAALPGMQDARNGSIVTVASQLALAGGRSNASYVASKGAVIALTRAIAVDYAADGIRANCIVPGAIETPMLERAFARAADGDAARRRSLERHALGRFGRPEEVASAAVFLASDESSFITGALLPVDGGWLAA